MAGEYDAVLVPRGLILRGLGRKVSHGAMLDFVAQRYGKQFRKAPGRPGPPYLHGKELSSSLVQDGRLFYVSDDRTGKEDDGPASYLFPAGHAMAGQDRYLWTALQDGAYLGKRRDLAGGDLVATLDRLSGLPPAEPVPDPEAKARARAEERAKERAEKAEARRSHQHQKQREVEDVDESDLGPGAPPGK